MAKGTSAKATYPIQLVQVGDASVTGAITVEISIPANIEPALDLLGIGREERMNLVMQTLSRIGQELGFNPGDTI